MAAAHAKIHGAVALARLPPKLTAILGARRAICSLGA
jgi:hypothetical protein